MAGENGKGGGERRPWGSNNFRPGVTGADQALLEELHGILEASGEVSGAPTATNIFSFMCRVVREKMIAGGHLKELKEKTVDEILSEGRAKRDEAKAQRESEQAAKQAADVDKSESTQTGKKGPRRIKGPMPAGWADTCAKTGEAIAEGQDMYYAGATKEAYTVAAGKAMIDAGEAVLVT